MLTIGTARDVLHSKIQNTPFNEFLLPTINVNEIIKDGVVFDLNQEKPKDQAKQKKQIIDLISGESELRSKRVLIEKFIQNNLPNIDNSEEVEDKFKTYWQEETKKALQTLSSEEALKQDKVEDIINDYLFTGRMATGNEVIEALENNQVSYSVNL